MLRKYIAKKRAVDLLGGACSRCGWNENIAALQFHHLDPNEKDFTIGRFLHKSWSFLEAELKKCVLLCANCHITEHTNRGPDFFKEVAACMARRGAPNGNRTR